VIVGDRFERPLLIASADHQPDGSVGLSHRCNDRWPDNLAARLAPTRPQPVSRGQLWASAAMGFLATRPAAQARFTRGRAQSNGVRWLNRLRGG